MSRFEPACMTDAEYALWLEAARLAARQNGEAMVPVCRDCPAAWRRENLLAGTCNGAERRGTGKPVHSLARRIQWREYHARRSTGTRIRRTPAELDDIYTTILRLRAEGVGWSVIGRRVGMRGQDVQKLWQRRQERAA